MSSHAAPSETPAAPAPRAAWLLYTLIVLEILFMVSPLAAYYYAVYGVPLNALADRPATAWLTQSILPHFSYSDSLLVNALIAVSWPLILLGLTLFLVGFVQIYHARFSGRGPVSGGLYRWIRHPQYLALALVGLGTTLFWSRYLVLIAFVAMLCLYVALARSEERRCLARFGDEYRDYLRRTGRLLPRRLEQALARLRPRLPGGSGARRTLAALLAALTLWLAVLLGNQLRAHALASLQIESRGPHAVLFLAPLAASRRAAVADLVARELGPEPRLVYVAPWSWSVPELGLLAAPRYPHDSVRELGHPGTHGNTGGFGPGPARALVTVPLPTVSQAGGVALLAATVRVRPESLLTVSPQTTGVLARQPAGPSLWPGIPVPVY